MATNQTSVAPQCSIVIHDDISEADNIPSMVCPLCSSRLKLYQIHYDEKFLMCCNIECVYPFGVTDYHIYKIECNEEFSKSETKSNAASTSGSLLSSSDWSDLDRIMSNVGSPLSPDSIPPSIVEKTKDMDKLEEVKKTVQNEETIKRNVRRIKELNKQLFRNDECDCISNEKWIAHIAQMQERSGIQLLKENELSKVKRVLPKVVKAGELKIDIGATQIAIKIQEEMK